VFWQSLHQLYPPPYFYVTYRSVDELSTPYDEVFFFSDVGIGERFHKVKDSSLGLVQEGCHCGMQLLVDGS
jgi:hypothetical protein